MNVFRTNSTRAAPQSYANKKLKRANSSAITAPNDFSAYNLSVSIKENFDEINKNLQIFTSNSTGITGTYEKNFSSFSKFSRNEKFSLLTEQFLTDKSNVLFAAMKSKITENQNIQVLLEQTNLILRTTLFLTQVFGNWHSKDGLSRSVQDKIYHVMKNNFESDEEFLNLFIKIIIDEINKERLEKEKAHIEKWPIDFIVSVGFEKVLVDAFAKDTKTYLMQNPITEFNPSTIVKNVEEVIANNDMIFATYPKRFYTKVSAVFRQTAYNMFITSSINEIFSSLYDSKNSEALNKLTVFIENSDNEQLKTAYNELWVSKTKAQITEITSKPGNTTIDDCLKLISFISLCKEKLDLKVRSKLEITIQRALNDMDTYGLYLIARYANTLINLGNFEAFLKIIPGIINLLKMFDNKLPFIEIHRHYYASRVIKYFGKPPAIEDTFNSAIQTVYDDEKFTGFKDIQADINRYVQEYSSFNANISFPIKFMVISPVGWPAAPLTNFPVPDEVTTARNLFEESYLKTHESTKLMWLPLLDEVTFTYKGVNFTGAYPYYAVFNCIVQNKSHEEAQIPKKYQTEVLLGLSKAGLITRMAGKYVVASFKPQRKTTKFPSLSAYLPKAPKVQSLDNLLIQRKPKIESLIVRTLKENIILSPDDLFAIVTEKSVFNIRRRDFDICVSSLLSTDSIAMGEDKKLRYVL